MKNGAREVVGVMGARLHCVGMAIHRGRHEDWSLFLAEPKARELLGGIYEEPELSVVIVEVLQAITSHRESGRPLTLEAGNPPLAHALGTQERRSLSTFHRGRAALHSASAAAVAAGPNLPSKA